MTDKKTSKRTQFSSLSEFVHSASSAEKKWVYGQVMERANARQQEVIRQYESTKL